LSAKIERKQTFHTVTHFSGSWGGGYGNGLTGGIFSGSGESTTTANDTAFLEVQFRLNEHEAPRYAALPFGAQRQWAESWVIAINELRR
jgi:L-ascorbate metabolism protein UlaG (beta-lactamase superfamily)